MEQYVMKNQKRLRCGITTGTCAAAAAKAAAGALLVGLLEETVTILTPKGIAVPIPVRLVGRGADWTEYEVEKDSGDDPDVTNHARIRVCVERMEKAEPPAKAFFEPEYPGLYLDGGEGVGRVTRAGLEQEPGQAAINRVPRQMIFQAVEAIRSLTEDAGRLLIRVKVPEGERLAARTFNPKLGILGGISILGSSGILEPMSEKALVDTIEAEIRQLHVLGVRQLLVMPGNYGRAYAQEALGLDLEGSVKCSNYVGETLDLAAAYGMESFLLVGNIGKLVKLAAGIMNTHSRVADGRGEILALHALLCGADRKLAEGILSCVNTEEMLMLLDKKGLREAVMRSLCGRIQEQLEKRVQGRMRCGAALFSEKYGCLGLTPQAAELLAEYRAHMGTAQQPGVVRAGTDEEKGGAQKE